MAARLQRIPRAGQRTRRTAPISAPITHATGHMAWWNVTLTVYRQAGRVAVGALSIMQLCRHLIQETNHATTSYMFLLIIVFLLRSLTSSTKSDKETCPPHDYSFSACHQRPLHTMLASALFNNSTIQASSGKVHREADMAFCHA